LARTRAGYRLGKGWAKAGGSACGPGGPALLFEKRHGIFPGAKVLIETSSVRSGA